MQLDRIQFRKIFSILLILLSLSIPRCGGGGGGSGGSTSSESAEGKVTLAWDSETDPAVASFRIYYGTVSRQVSGTYEHSMDIGLGAQISNDTTAFTLTGLTKGQTYYLAVTAYDKSGIESDFSSEVSGNPK